MTAEFSVLIPTRDRLEYLLQAIETVRRQDYPSWEIVVSDNASQMEVSSSVRALGDPRIQYLRQPDPIPVTENWNAALTASSGNWMVMLGDDDGLMPGALQRAKEVIEQFNPDSLYVGAWSLIYPGAVPAEPNGAVRPYFSPLLASRQPFILGHKDAQALVARAARFEMPVTFNMQHTWVRRDLVDRLSSEGPFFRSPYPDFYATNAVLASAERLVVCPDPLVAIGITPKSFGSFYFSGREGDGVTFLGNPINSSSPSGRADRAIDGSPDRTSWLRAMEELAAGPVPNLRIDYGRYRRLVLLAAFGGGARAVRDRDARHAIIRQLSRPERWFVVPAIRFAAWVFAHVPPALGGAARRAIHRRVVRSPTFDDSSVGAYQNMLELFARPPSVTNAARKPR
jgi:hypothetical protein